MNKEGAPDFDLHKASKKVLKNMGDLRQASKCPDAQYLDEWLAVHTVDFFNHLNILYGSISEFCTAKTCPFMNVGSKIEYRWQEDGKRPPIRCSAPEYVERLFTWIQGIIDDEKIFPVQPDAPFAPSFREVVKTILKRLFRVYAHIYYHHFDKIKALGEEAHINTCFQHFYYFVDEFKLVDHKEMLPLEALINGLCGPLKKK